MRSVHKTEEGGGDEGEAAKATECPAGKRGRPSEGHSKHECHSPLREMSPPICPCVLYKGPRHPRHVEWAVIGQRGSPLRAVVSVSEILGLVVAQASERGRERGRGRVREERARSDAHPRPPPAASGVLPLSLSRARRVGRWRTSGSRTGSLRPRAKCKMSALHWNSTSQANK